MKYEQYIRRTLQNTCLIISTSHRHGLTDSSGGGAVSCNNSSKIFLLDV